MNRPMKVSGVLILLLVAFMAAGCRDGAGGGQVGVVRNGGPYDNKKIKDCLAPAAGRKWIGLNSTTHKYPAANVQRYFKITSNPGEAADLKGVVTAKTADGFNLHLSGTFFFETTFSCDKTKHQYEVPVGNGTETKTVNYTPRELVEDFDNQFGVRKFPDPEGDGPDLAPWESGDKGWGAFLNANVLPIIQNELRIAGLKFTCEEVVSSCALVASRQTTIDKATAKKTGVNLQRVQNAIVRGFSEGLIQVFGKPYFTNIRFTMSQPELDPDIEAAINTSLASFALVSQSQAGVQQAANQAKAAGKLAKIYSKTPALAELEKWRIICGASATAAQKSSKKSPTHSGCNNIQIITGLGNSSVLVGKR